MKQIVCSSASIAAFARVYELYDNALIALMAGIALGAIVTAAINTMKGGKKNESRKAS